jgi:hypothetical protein
MGRLERNMQKENGIQQRLSSGENPSKVLDDILKDKK